MSEEGQEQQGDAAGQGAGAGSGAGEQDWRTQLGEIGQHPSLGPVKDEDFVQVPRGVVKRYVDQQQYLGTDKIPKPRDDWSDEQWGEFYQQLGRPETPDAYQLPEVETPEGFGVDEDLKNTMLQSAHAAGLNEKQFGKLWQDFMGKQVERHQREEQEAQQQDQQALSELKTRLGAKFDAQLDLANRALKTAAGDDQDLVERWKGLELKSGMPLLSHPAFIEVLGALGSKLHEGDLMPGEGNRGYAKTPDQLQQELEEFRTANGAALADESHPQHKVLTQKWNDLSDALARARGQT